MMLIAMLTLSVNSLWGQVQPVANDVQVGWETEIKKTTFLFITWHTYKETFSAYGEDVVATKKVKQNVNTYWTLGGVTLRAGSTSWGGTYSPYTTNNATDSYVGYTVTVAPGYYYTLKSIAGSFAVSDNITWKVTVEKADGTVLYSNQKTITNYSSGSATNLTFNASGLGSDPSRQNLTGTFYVKVHATHKDDKYYLVRDLKITGDVARDPYCQNTYDMVYWDSSSRKYDMNCFEQDPTNSNIWFTREMRLPNATTYQLNWEDGRDNTKAYTQNTNFGSMPHGKDNLWTLGTNSTGAVGRFRIYDNSMDRNKGISFYPSEYTLQMGTGTLASWKNDTTHFIRPQSSNPEETTWLTDTIDLTKMKTAVGSAKVWVGFMKYEDPEYVQMAKSQVVALSGVSGITGRTSDRGTFRITSNANTNNLDLTFVPWYRVTYNANGGSGEIAPSMDVPSYGDAAARTLTVEDGSSLTRSNYTFAGWDTAANGTGTAYAPGDPIVISANTTLYAQWKGKATVVTLNGNKRSTNGNGTATLYYGDNMSAATSVTHVIAAEGYQLKGYYTAASGGTKVIDYSGGAYTLAKNVRNWTDAQGNWIVTNSTATLYAQYNTYSPICRSIGAAGNISKNNTDYSLGTTVVRLKGLSLPSGQVYADIDDAADEITIQNPSGIEYVRIKAWYPGEEDHLYVHYSPDNLTWTAIEWVVLSHTEPVDDGWVLSVPGGTKYIRIEHTRTHRVRVSNICVKEGNSGKAAPVVTWTQRPQDAKVGAVVAGTKATVTIASTAGYPTAEVTGYYSTQPAIATIAYQPGDKTGTITCLSAGETTICPEVTVRYFSGDVAHMFVGDYERMEVISTDGCRTKVMMWKETALFDGKGINQYTYSYTPANHYPNSLALNFIQGSGVSSNNKDRAMENEGSALTTGKYAGGGFIFTPVGVGAKFFDQIRFFGKMEAGEFEYTTDGTNWFDYVNGATNGGVTITTGTVGSDAIHTIAIQNEISAFGIRNKGTSGATHKGMWIRNMGITVCGGGEDCEAPRLLTQSPALTYFEDESGTTLSVTPEGTIGDYTYQWYRCNYQGANREVISGATSNSITLSGERLPNVGTTYYVCHVHKSDCEAVAHSRVFAVTRYPSNPLVRWTLEQSAATGSGITTVNVESRDEGHVSGVSPFAPHTGAAPANNTFVGAMTTRLKITESTQNNAVYDAFAFHMEDQYYLMPTEVILEIQPISYESEMFRAVLIDETGQYIEGSLSRPASGVGNIVSFVYDRDIRLQGEITLKLYAWDAGHNDALYRLGTRVSIYGEVLTKPEPELSWVIAPENGKENSDHTILAESSNSTRPVSYSTSDASIAYYDSENNNLRYANPGKVTIYATVTGDGYYSVGTTTIQRTIIIDKENPESDCTVPNVTITGDDGDGTKSFCEQEVANIDEPYASWTGLEASDNTVLLENERRIIQWFKDGNEVAFVEFNKDDEATLTYKPSKPGVYKAVVTVYNAVDQWATKQSREASIRFRLLEAPDKPTISGLSTVEQTHSVTLTAQSQGATSYIWYMQPAGSSRQVISGATGPSYSFATDANTSLGRYYFYCQGSTENFPIGDRTHDCNNSELSSAFAIDVTPATGCDWHYKLDHADAIANKVEVCQHIDFKDNAGNPIPFNQNWLVTGCALEDQSFAFTKVTSPVIPSIDFPVMAGHTGTGYMFVRGEATLQYLVNGENQTNFAISSASMWQLFTLPLDGGATNNVYTITSDRPIQIAICAAHVCQELFDDWNIPTLTIVNNDACGSVNLIASGYNVGAHLTLVGVSNTGSPITPQVENNPAATHTFTVNQSGTYWVVSSNGSDKQSNSTLAVVRVGSAPVFNSLNPLPTNLDGYVGRTYSVTADIPGATTYQWYLCTKPTKSEPGAMVLPLDGENNKTFTRAILPAYVVEDRYNFFCVGTNACGSAETNIMHLNAMVDPNPEQQECTTPADDELYFEPTATTINFGDAFTKPTLHNTHGLRVTYSSSSPMVAQVDPETGDVTQVSVGTTYISVHADEQVVTGLGSEDITYCEKDIYYTLTINATTPYHYPTIISDGTELSCEGLLLTVKNDAADYDPGTTTFQWYRNHIAIPGATGSTYTATAAGSYAVHVLCGYGKWANDVVLTDANAPVVEKLSPFHYYRKGCNYQAATDQPVRHLFKVSPKGTGATPWQVRGYKRTKDGSGNHEMVNSTILTFVRPDPSDVNTVILDLRSMEKKLSTTGSVQEGDTVLIVCIPRDGCNNFNPYYADSIAIAVVPRDRRSLGYIVSGGNRNDVVLGGDLLTGYNPHDLRMQTSLNSWSLTGNPLYLALQDFYDVTPLNGYAYDDLTGTNKYQFEPYDLLVLTDYVHPNLTKTGGVTSTNYVDALANLVDFRPMLSMKAAVSGELEMLPTWYSRGFNAQVYTPIVQSATEALDMYALCPEHRVYNYLTAQRPVNPGDAVQVVTSAGLDHNKALSGFRLSDLTGFANIATICNNGEESYGSSLTDVIKEPLIYSFERQKTASARMVVMPIDVYASSVVSTRGTELARGILEYLLLDAAEVSDCGFIFDNHSGDGSWATVGNWAPRYNAVPTTGADVRIMAPCTVPAGTITNGVGKVTLYDGGSLTVAPTAALRSWGGIGEGTMLEQHPLTDPSRLYLQSSAAGNAALIHGDHVGQTHATVEMYSKATGSWNDAHTLFTPAAWQWMTTPFTDVTDVQNYYYGAWLNEWDNANKTWIEVTNGMPMTAFRGYCITQETDKTYTMQGTLASTADITLEAPYKGKRAYLFGNSWTAPIHIYEFRDEDFENLDRTIVLFDAGISTREDPQGGQYISVPIHAAEDMEHTIPSMQSFQVKALPSASKETASGLIRLRLNYDRLVQFTGDSRDMILEPMHAPGRAAAGQETLHNGNTAKIVLTITGENAADRAYLFENPSCTVGYDNGWDGAKVMGDAAAPQLFVLNEAGNWAVSTQDELEGTQLALRRGMDNTYTFTFEYVGEDSYYLLDTQTNIYTPITNETRYQFVTSADMDEARFFITRHMPNTPTDLNTNGVGSKRQVHKFLQDEVIYISVDGILYNMNGKVVR